jgi:hypothetical protein
MTTKIRDAWKHYLAVREELGLTVLGQFVVRRYGRLSDKPGFTGLSVRQQARGRRILERGRRRIRRRERRRTWVEIKDRGYDGISIFLARYGTGYPADVPYEEAVKIAKVLNDHGGSRSPVEITVEFGFGRQALLFDGKLIESAREQLNQIIARRQQAQQDHLNYAHAAGFTA